MKPKFAETKNYRTFANAYDELCRRGASEAGIAVVTGEPGLGKTRALEWWAVKFHAPMLRAVPGWTVNWFLRDLLKNLNIPPERSGERMTEQARHGLETRFEAARSDDSPFALIIDEIDHVSRNRDVLETIRYLSDKLEMPTILIGMERVIHNLVRFPQIASRIGRYIEFTPAPLEDTQLLVSELCEVKVKADLVELIHRESKGKFRETKEAIASVERVGRKAGTVGIAEMAGKVLMNDRATGRPIVVKA